MTNAKRGFDEFSRPAIPRTNDLVFHGVSLKVLSVFICSRDGSFSFVYQLLINHSIDFHPSKFGPEILVVPLRSNNSGFYNTAAVRRPQNSLIPKRELYTSSVRELYVSESLKSSSSGGFQMPSMLIVYAY